MHRSPATALARALMIGIAALVLFAADTAPLYAAAKYVRVANVSPGKVTWMRAGPGTSFKKVKPLPYNIRHIWSYGCRRVAFQQWCQVRHLGVRGWVAGRYLAEERTRKI